MLAGILNSALLIVIVLDVVGAAVYFGLTCWNRFQDGRGGIGAQHPTFPTIGGLGFGRPLNGGLVPVPAGASALAVYGSTVHSPAPSETSEPGVSERGLAAGLRLRIESFGGKFSKRAKTSFTDRQRSEGQSDSDHQVQGKVTKLNRILDSFKEDL